MDVNAKNASLRCMFGDDRSSQAPATWAVALYDADPNLAGVELDATGGYAAQSLANSTANFPAPASGATTSAAVSFGTSSGAWSDTATHVGLKDGSGNLWYSRPLAEPITVTAAGQVVPPVRVVVTMNQEA